MKIILCKTLLITSAFLWMYIILLNQDYISIRLHDTYIHEITLFDDNGSNLKFSSTDDGLYVAIYPFGNHHRIRFEFPNESCIKYNVNRIISIMKLWPVKHPNQDLNIYYSHGGMTGYVYNETGDILGVIKFKN